ncbi:MAG: 30S ribosomal protein S6 [SAR202 cluster bacterium]|nr:30S ribosomal protein S6 [SAR202 cluster bacterium]
MKPVFLRLSRFWRACYNLWVVRIHSRLRAPVVSERVREYELVMIIRPEATEQEVTGAMERVATFVTEHGGEMGETKSWGLKQLAYPIARRKEGIYSSAKFKLNSQGAQELGKALKISEDIIRHLVTKVE